MISAVTSPGDRIAFETLTYSQISRSAGLIGRRIALVESDEFGMRPEDFERVCAQQHPKLAFLMPGAQNPTVAVMPLDRRQAIADIARKYGVWLVEDNLYGSMTGDPLPLLMELAPERTFLVGGLSKSVAAGVRGGWVACPPHFSQRIRVAHKMGAAACLSFSRSFAPVWSSPDRRRYCAIAASRKSAHAKLWRARSLRASFQLASEDPVFLAEAARALAFRNLQAGRPAGGRAHRR